MELTGQTPKSHACPEPSNAELAAQALATGLRTLRAKGLLCDVALVAGEERLLAHQAVLAAASLPLRQYLAESAEAEPQPLELQLTGGERPEAVRALLDQAYGAESSGVAAPGAEALLRSLSLQAPTAANPSALAAGLCELQIKGSLCDLVLVVGGERLPAHQAVLAAASAPLRRYILDSLAALLEQHAAPREAASEASKARAPQVSCEPVELELAGVSCPEAARVFLNHVYGAPGAAPLPDTEAAIRDVLRLAHAFELPRLRESAAQWLSRGVNAGNAPERLSICEEFGFVALGSRIQELASEQAAPLRPQQSPEPESSMDQPEQREEEETGEQGKSVRDAILADPALMSGMTELDCAMLCISTAHFADTSVPDAPRRHIVEDMEKTRTRQDARTLERLYDLFDQRPVWLEGPLLKQLPAHVEQSTVLRLLPCVAYQWRDGPWQTAYARYGWDPRDHPEEAKWLQVIDFRDPHLRGARPVARGSQAVSDCHFRRPPSQRKESYQLVDIKDDYITDIVRGSEPSEECSRRTGWLEQVLYDAFRERLTVRSQQLRERQAAREQAEKGKKRSAGRRSSGEGSRSQRQRTGGA